MFRSSPSSFISWSCLSARRGTVGDDGSRLGAASARTTEGRRFLADALGLDAARSSHRRERGNPERQATHLGELIVARQYDPIHICTSECKKRGSGIQSNGRGEAYAELGRYIFFRVSSVL